MAIILIIFTIIGGISGLYYLIINLRPKRKFSWKDIEKGVIELVKKINEDNFHPDLVVGIGRGGAILGGLIAGNLGVIPMATIDRRYLWEKRKRKVEIVDFGNLDISGRKILLVSAEPYTGETLKMAYQYVANKSPKEIKTASLWRTEITVFVPDYYVYEVKSVEHVPWRILPAYKRDSKVP